MIDYTPDMTPIVQSRSVETQQSAFSSFQGDLGSALQTQFSSLRAPAVTALWHSAVGGTGDAPANSLGAMDFEPEVVSSAEASNTASVRALMLARKFGTGVDKEELSRIEILTARLRKLAPRVTDEQIDLQAEMVGMVEDVSSKLASLRERLNAV